MAGAPSDKKRFRSQEWFDNPGNPGMTALYLERYLGVSSWNSISRSWFAKPSSRCCAGKRAAVETPKTP